MSVPRLELRGIWAGYPGAAQPTLRGVDLALEPGEIVVIAGPSGSGKSTLLAAIAGLLPLARGEIRWEGEALRAEGSAPRGSGIGWIAQDPLAALHPLMTVGHQVAEGLEGDAQARARHWLENCGLMPAAHFLERYPHQLSGGERQRALLALCLAREPRMILADEPTSMLDPVLARAWTRLLIGELRRRGASLVFVTHEPARIAPHADRCLRLEDGRLVAHAADAWSYPPPEGSAAVPGRICAEVEGLRVRRDPGQPPVLEDFSLTLHAGEIVAVVGASGAGKTSLALALAGHLPHEAGRIEFPMARSARPAQLCFQDPRASFDPRRSLARSLADAGPLARAPLETLGLEKLDLERRPQAFSGGERARLALARALMAEPELLIYDEPLAALDMELRVRLVEHWRRVARAGRVAQLLVSHDMALVRAVADRVVVLEAGRCVEAGSAEALFRAPQSSAARALFEP
jgi:ABC-type glutathione transport system ATPase component